MDKDKVISIMSSPPTLSTERLILRKLEISDAKDMYEYSCDPDVTEYLTWEPHKSLRFTVNYLNGVNAAYRDGLFYDWALELKATGKMIGTCGYTSFDFENNSLEIGYVLNPRYEGYGLMSEAVRKVLSFAFVVLGTSRAESRYMLQNIRSRAVMERCGMKFEGVRKAALLHKGNYIDIGVCSISEKEFFTH